MVFDLIPVSQGVIFIKFGTLCLNIIPTYNTRNNILDLTDIQNRLPYD